MVRALGEGLPAYLTSVILFHISLRELNMVDIYLLSSQQTWQVGEAERERACLVNVKAKYGWI